MHANVSDSSDPGRAAVDVVNVSKTFASVRAVQDLSFTVRKGEIFGLLGSNGAGKTTTIRMVLDIIRPDRGEITLLGGPMTEAKKTRIGYLPEERGLYDDMTVIDTLTFLGRLKELSRREARSRAETYLRRVDLYDARNLKIEALSRGMRQKAQFVAATMHEPDLVIIDEPFSGLDPVNTRIIKKLLYDMRDRGAAIIMSTHQMNQVEEMCQRILLIDHGRSLLYGDLSEIRNQFAENVVKVELDGAIDHLPGVSRISQENGAYRLLLEEETLPAQVLETLVQAPDVTVRRFEQVTLSMDDIFVRLVGHGIDEDGRRDGQATGAGGNDAAAHQEETTA